MILNPYDTNYKDSEFERGEVQRLIVCVYEI